MAAPESPSNTHPTVAVNRDEAGCLVVRLRGNWCSQVRSPSSDTLEAEVSRSPAPRELRFDTSALANWNTSLLAFVARCVDLCEQRQVAVNDESLPEGVRRLLRLARAVPEKTDARHKPETVPWVQKVGELTQALGAGFMDFTSFLGENLLALVRLIRGRAQLRWNDLLLVLQQAGPSALGIVALINFLSGLILAYVGAVQLARFGATVYVADLVAVATVREMASVMTAVIMCGRTGASFAAQLGTMKVNEEIDALSTFGFPPVDFLVLPRVLALVVVMPFLCVFAALIGILGGGAVALLQLDVAPIDYLNRTIESITLSSFLLGVFKGGVFGAWVALVGCWRGMRCGSNAAAVGEATTSAVVIGITGIVAGDGLFAVLSNALNI
jgi:phospholipid/cholesterol/gamma-HCH transport system permease protein